MKNYRIVGKKQLDKEEVSTIRRGTIHYFDTYSGRGVICLSSGENAHFRQSDVIDKESHLLQRGQCVAFLAIDLKGRLRAKQIRIIPIAPKRKGIVSSTTTPKEIVPSTKIINPQSIFDGSLIQPHSKAGQAVPVTYAQLPDLKIISPIPCDEYVRKVTPLMLAVREGDLQQVRLLLREKYNPNARRRDGLTALMIAVRQHEIAHTHEPRQRMLVLLVELLNAGANPNMRAKSGHRAVDLANGRKQKSIINLLQEASLHHKEFLSESIVDLASADPFIGNQASNFDVIFDNFCEERYESSEGLAFMKREEGKFGSFPLHDDYSDESQSNDPNDSKVYD